MMGCMKYFLTHIVEALVYGIRNLESDFFRMERTSDSTYYRILLCGHRSAVGLMRHIARAFKNLR